MTQRVKVSCCTNHQTQKTTTKSRRLTGVRLHVLVKVLLHVEVLAAPLAHELLMSDVDAHVGAQLVFVLEALVAVLKEKFKKRENVKYRPRCR